MHDPAEELQLLPEWRQAVKDFLASEFKQGDTIPKAWLEVHFGMTELHDGKPLLPNQWNARQFEWMRNMDAFRSELLDHHRIYLENVIGHGYRIVPPREQTVAAQEKFEREAKKSYRNAANTLKNIKVNELTETERRENLDAVAKLSMLRGMHKAALE